jgi:hypothetical protein
MLLDSSPTASCSLTPVQKNVGFLSREPTSYSQLFPLSWEIEQESENGKSYDTTPEELKEELKKKSISLAIGSVPFRLENQCILSVKAMTDSFHKHLVVASRYLHNRDDGSNLYRFNRRNKVSSHF